MSYTKEQLKAMAEYVVDADEAKDSRIELFYMQIAFMTGIHPRVVRNMIFEMAKQ